MRYADDFVVGFQHRTDAERFLAELRERLAKFALELHPDKTRVIEFGRYATERRSRRGEGKPSTFDFLGFTHICGKTRKGRFVVVRQTVRKRMQAKLKDLKEGLRRRMHLPVREVGQWLRAAVDGYFRYHAVPRNYPSLKTFRNAVVHVWLRTLRRRSQKARVTWRRMMRWVEHWIPKPRILHPYPEQRVAVMTRGRSPVR